MKKKQEEVSKMILNYLRKNPEAADTLEGISEWWLNFKKIEISVDEVANALECLIEEGILEKKNNKDGNSFIIKFVKRIKK